MNNWTETLFIKLRTLLGEQGNRDSHAVRFRDLNTIYAEARRVAVGAATLPSNINEIITNAVGGTIQDAVAAEVAAINQAIQEAEQDVADFATALAASQLVVAGLESATAVLTNEVAQTNAEIDAAVVTLRAESAAAIGDVNATFTEVDTELDQIRANVTAVTTQVGAASTSIAAEIVQRTNADSALAAQITSLTSRVGDAEADITAESLARSNGDTALAAQVNTLNASVQGANAAISAESVTRANAVSALSAQVTQVNASTTNNAAAINGEIVARTNADSALAAQINTVSTVANNATAAITTEATTRQTQDSALAASIQDVSSTFSTASGVLASTFLEPIIGNWSTGGTVVTAANELHAIGQTRTYTVGASEQRGSIANGSTVWVGQKNADAYVVEVDFTLVSGTLDGAGVMIFWQNTANQNFDSRKRLAEMLQAPLVLGQPMTARALLKKPTAFVGTYNQNIGYCLANWGGFLPMAAKTIKFHRFLIRVATAEEVETGNLGAGLNAANAAISQEATTRAAADTALSGQINTVNSSLNSLSSTVSGQGTALNTLTTRVTAAEGGIVSLSNAQQVIEASVSSIADTQQGYRVTLDAVGKLTAGAAGAVAANTGALGQTATLRVTEGATARVFTGATNGASVQIPPAVAAILAGQRVKIGVLAYRATSNTSTRFGIAYSAGTPGNSGYLNADRDLTTNPQWFEFFYTVPFATAANQTHHIGIFADSTKTGKSAVFAKINVEISAVAGELPEITTLEAAVAAEQTARASGDAALSTSIASVSAVANARNRTFRQSTAPSGAVVGDIWYNTAQNNRPSRWSGSNWDDATDTRIATIQSQVTQQSTALATLEGNASAMYALRVGAGGAAAGFEVVAADNPISGPASTIRMHADNILLDGTVGVNKLLVSDFSNIILNPMFAGGSFDKWDKRIIGSGTMVADSTAPSGWAIQLARVTSETSVSYPANFNSASSFVEGIPVKVGDQFRVTALVKSTVNSGNAGLEVVTRTASGTIAVTWMASSNGAGAGGWTEIAGNFTSTVNGVAFVRLLCYSNNSTVRFGRVEMRRKSGTVLIEDGAVTADKINVNSLSAISANLGSIVVGTANIGDLSVNSLKIQGQAVTTDKLAPNAVTSAITAARASFTGSQYLNRTVFMSCLGGRPVAMWLRGSVVGTTTAGDLTFRVWWNGTIIYQLSTQWSSASPGSNAVGIDEMITLYSVPGTNVLVFDAFGSTVRTMEAGPATLLELKA